MAKSNTSSSTPAKNTTPATSSPSATSGVLTERQHQRWEQERDSVQERYDLVSKKLGLLGKAYAIETDVSTKLKLEVQIQDTETEQNRLNRQLEEIEQKLL